MPYIKIISEFKASVANVHFDDRVVFNETTYTLNTFIEKFQVVPNDTLIEDLKCAIENLISKSEYVHFGELENNLANSIYSADQVSDIVFSHNWSDFFFEDINTNLKNNKYTFSSFQTAKFNPFLELGLDLYNSEEIQ